MTASKDPIEHVPASSHADDILRNNMGEFERVLLIGRDKAGNLLLRSSSGDQDAVLIDLRTAETRVIGMFLAKASDPTVKLN